jgi:HK97 family phage major capsid protein
LTEIPNEILYRTATFERSGKDNRRARLAFSSEEPYERFFGIEILDHSASSIDLSFLKSGRAPVLVDHNSTDHVGVVESVDIGNDRVGRANVRFGKSQRANEIWQDVKDNIRLNVSVGYRVNKMDRVENTDTETFRVTDWTPLEISIVSIPADTTVGVGRNYGANPMPNTNNEYNHLDDFSDLGAHQADTAKERGRVQDILALAKRHKSINNIDNIAQEAIAAGTPIEAFKSTVLNMIPDETPIGSAENSGSNISIRSNDQRLKSEMSQFSFGRALAVLSNHQPLDGREAELQAELTNVMGGRRSEGFYMPVNSLFETRTDMITGTDSIGGYLVGTEHRPDMFIDSLSNATIVKDLGATVITGLQGDIAIPRLDTGLTASWVAEGSAASESNATIGQVSLSPKQITANATWSRKLLVQSLPGIEQLARQDIMRQLALAIDLAAINGSGASNQPRGILNVTGIGSVALGTNGAAPTYSAVSSLVKEVATDNALMGNVAFMGNSAVSHKLRTTAKVSSTDSVMIQEEPDKLLGYKYGETNQVPSDLTKGSGTDLSALIIGNMSDLLIGEWGVIEVIVDPYTEADTGNVRIAAHGFVDIAVRHAQSFASIADMITT